MSDAVAPVPQEGVRAAIRRAADATGVDFSLLVETARRESAFDPSARARTSSATGLFQFVDATWLDMVRRHGDEHGLAGYARQLRGGNVDAATRNDILALRADPELSARMAGELAQENAAALRAALGRAPAAGELYAAHVLGAGGAVRLINAAAQGAGDAAQLFPREAGANRGLFYAQGQPRCAQAVLQRLDLDASGAVSPVAATRAEPETPLSPALAQALFAIALLPLLRSGEEEAGRSQALSAYARLGQSSGGGA